ncbi:MAG: NHLP bacteriocin export ABC transporter permease/ATPase subunit [Clostridiales bacterium]|nr:NHLP bacteriocin export ABC transporter permease/ATPase subunit [Clostridiales bacterium]
MGWFDEQVRQVKKNDQEAFEESIFRMASVVLGRHDSDKAVDQRIVTKASIDEILKYYRYKPVEIPKNIKDPDDQLEFCLRPYGLMRRSIKLSEGWYKDAFGPILAYRKEDGIPVALLPRRISGYYYTDPDHGTRVNVDKKTASIFDADAVCFYRPLPLKELGISDLLLYMKECVTVRDLSVYIILSVITTLVGMITPHVTRILTGPVLESKNISFLIGTAIFMISVSISSMLMGAVNGLGLNRINIKTSLGVEAAVMSRVLNLPANFFREYSSGELSSRVGSVNQLCILLVSCVFSGGISSLSSLLYITQIFRYAPALVVPALLIITATVVISVTASLMQIKYSKKALESGARNYGMSFALISGIQKIKLAGAEKRAFARWAHSYSESASYVYNKPLFLIVNPAISLAVSLCGTIVLYYLAVTTNVTPPDYLAFNAAYGAVMSAFTALASIALSVANIKPILDMAEPILKTKPESSENKEILTSISGNIELSNVCFRYKESMPYVIDGLNLKIKSGEYIAIVGSTGCGKSTLVRLLLGFETPEKGAIYYDGKDIARLDLRSLRRKIGSVTQNGSLFQGDIYSNIVISAPHLTLDDAWAAVELAGIADDIHDMPMGMNTMISEGQGGISGGQKQRLMIARAVAHKPRVLIFDEATSALDNKTQKQVSDALDGLKCTRIVIAHRLSTIKHCDRILVLDKGHIVEDGTYDELIARQGMFAELVARQRLDT